MAVRFSVRKRLLLGLLSALFLTWLTVLWLAYLTTSQEVGEIYDASLAQYARVMATLMVHEAREEEQVNRDFAQVVRELGAERTNASPLLTKLIAEKNDVTNNDDYLKIDWLQSTEGHPYESKIAFLVRTSDGQVLLRSSAQAPLQQFETGFQMLEHDDGSRWRVFGLDEPLLGLQVMVGENVIVRSEIEKSILINGLWPMLASFPVMALFIWGGVSKGLAPLRALAETLSKRSPSSLEPIQEQDTPVEVMPLVSGLNLLLGRVSQARDNERRFTANAAHELRTPLAALKTHAQVLQMQARGENLASVNEMLVGIERATHLLEQLLTLARTEARSSDDISSQSINLAHSIQRVISDVSGMAFAKNIQLSFDDRAGKSRVAGDETLLRVLLRNLLDNAIRYTPANGEVNVALYEAADIVHLTVQDTGPGIPADQVQRLFQRFQRGHEVAEQGAGLGLSIVSQIARLHNIDIKFVESDYGSGLRVELLFASHGPV